MEVGLETVVSAVFHEGINEVIATTLFNAAPMGIIRKEDSFSMIIFKTSHTAKNVIRDGWIVANITHDPILFVKTAFEDLPESWFIPDKTQGYLIHRLQGMSSWVIFQTAVVNETPDRIYVTLMPVGAEINQTYPSPVNRGLSNIIEATVHGTRFLLTHDTHLADLIRHHASLVLRCGGPNERKALTLLYSYLNGAHPDIRF